MQSNFCVKFTKPEERTDDFKNFSKIKKGLQIVIKEVCVCDRCGREIQGLEMRRGYVRKRKSIEMDVYTNHKKGFIPNDTIVEEYGENVVVDICMFYAEGRKTVHLCEQCAKEYLKFMDGKKGSV